MGIGQLALCCQEAYGLESVGVGLVGLCCVVICVVTEVTAPQSRPRPPWVRSDCFASVLRGRVKVGGVAGGLPIV